MIADDVGKLLSTGSHVQVTRSNLIGSVHGSIVYKEERC
jgi:hypothetical protein